MQNNMESEVETGMMRGLRFGATASEAVDTVQALNAKPRRMVCFVPVAVQVVKPLWLEIVCDSAAIRHI